MPAWCECEDEDGCDDVDETGEMRFGSPPEEEAVSGRVPVVIASSSKLKGKLGRSFHAMGTSCSQGA